jgi:hypothetical protein
MALKNRPITKEEIKSKCYWVIEAETPSTINWDDIIGQGTYGIILGTIHEENMVVKVANKTSNCNEINHEFILHEKALESLQIIKSENHTLPIFCPKITNFLHTKGCCWYYMSKIYKETSFNKLIHCLIYNSNDDKTVEKWSGIFPIVEDLKNWINQFKQQDKLNPEIIGIESIAYYNGIIFGLLHYGSMQTGQDIEIVLGKESLNGMINVFFYDFDKSQLISDFDDNTIKLLVQSLSGSYSKFLGEIGEKFKDGYRYSAEKFDKLDYCNEVIGKCEALENMLLDDIDGGTKIKEQKRRTQNRNKTKKIRNRKIRKIRKIRKTRKTRKK